MGHFMQLKPSKAITSWDLSYINSSDPLAALISFSPSKVNKIQVNNLSTNGSFIGQGITSIISNPVTRVWFSLWLLIALFFFFFFFGLFGFLKKPKLQFIFTKFLILELLSPWKLTFSLTQHLHHCLCREATGVNLVLRQASLHCLKTEEKKNFKYENYFLWLLCIHICSLHIQNYKIYKRMALDWTCNSLSKNSHSAPQLPANQC